MPITIRDDAVYLILKKIDEANADGQAEDIRFTNEDFSGIKLEKSDILGHLDYLNQKQYIDAEFTGNAYGNQEDVPDVINPDEVNARVANTLGAEDGPLPHLITFKRAQLTQKGQQMLAEMKEKPPESLQASPKPEIPEEHMSFLRKVMAKGNLSDLYDARDITEVVFRVMRDVMSTQEADRVESELEESAAESRDKSLQVEISELWHDTNPLVSFLSRLRPPLKGTPPFGIDSELFLKRIDREAAVPKTSNGRIATSAVFSATKEELTEERIQEIAGWLPEGEVRELWQSA